jgi:N6-L-threonylcarbamoyladenine synthase
MKILAIETSCDETAIAIVETKENKGGVSFKILGNEVSSQIDIHSKYGGVFPMMAKREHAKNIVGVLEKALKEARLYKEKKRIIEIDSQTKKKINKILEREGELFNNFINFVEKINNPRIDAMAVTVGPGLEPALWVGISFAKALSTYLKIPIIPVNHMEGHIFSVYPENKNTFVVKKDKKMFPILSLLVSGGHTELVLIRDWMKYKKIGKTRDDASGEAFDKVARMLELTYPGGPQISKLAKEEREKEEQEKDIVFPRPMINSKDYDFSFSGLKTSVLYTIRNLKEKNPKILDDIKIKQKIAKEFEDSVVEVLTSKTLRALKEYKAKTLIVGGGVSANNRLEEVIRYSVDKKIKVFFPTKKLSGDNGLMIAVAGYFQFKNKNKIKKLNANGNLSL